MEGYRKCKIGHLFKDELTMCPYCPDGRDTVSDQSMKLNDKTEINPSDSSSNIKKTESKLDHPTEIFDTYRPQSIEPKFDFNRTIIQDLGIGENGKNANNNNTKTARKIIGWIISYSHDLMGMDFRLYEGNNSIGRDAENSITIKNDGSISGTHVIILYRLNKCYIRDEMASNGTFINGNLIEVGQSHELHDGDIIGLGSNTTFRYRSAL